MAFLKLPPPPRPAIEAAGERGNNISIRGCAAKGEIPNKTPKQIRLLLGARTRGNNIGTPTSGPLRRAYVSDPRGSLEPVLLRPALPGAQLRPPWRPPRPDRALKDSSRWISGFAATTLGDGTLVTVAGVVGCHLSCFAAAGRSDCGCARFACGDARHNLLGALVCGSARWRHVGSRVRLNHLRRGGARRGARR
jgi:hypothetical protein